MSLTLDEEQVAATADDEAFTAMLGRLSRQSITPGKHFDAYVDVDWDAPEHAIDPDDPRWEVSPSDPLASTDWYRHQPAEVRSRIGLHGIATAMKTGLQFESVLKRGLLEYAMTLPNGSPEFRYLYHEVIEEAQHSLMFQEFVNRTQLDPPGLPWWMKIGTHQVVRFGRRFPELFFLFVLGGEDPIDHFQRQTLRSDREVHPLFERIMRIHVTEEARHLSFARMELKRRVPQLGRIRRFRLSVRVPLLLGVMSGAMLEPSSQMIATYRIPKPVVKEAFSTPEARQGLKDAVAKVRRLCVELGLVTPLTRPIWRRLGIWDDDER
ncbi:MAG: hypothetical protein JWO37_4085 [Acidimicrobiales bacterium]|jgi:hypothetical protein|nr:hypothetical protein [Acidimicrobiales bacterium]